MALELEELQLRLEAEVCGLGMEALTDLAKQLQLNIEALKKLTLSKEIRKKIEQDIKEVEDKKGLLSSLAALVDGTPPPLDDEDKQNQVKKLTDGGSLFSSPYICSLLKVWTKVIRVTRSLYNKTEKRKGHVFFGKVNWIADGFRHLLWGFYIFMSLLI